MRRRTRKGLKGGRKMRNRKKARERPPEKIKSKKRKEGETERDWMGGRKYETDRNDGKTRGEGRKGTNRCWEGEGMRVEGWGGNVKEGWKETHEASGAMEPLTWKGRVQVICLMTQVTYKAPGPLTSPPGSSDVTAQLPR